MNNCKIKYMLATCRKLFEINFHGSYMRIIPQHMSGHVRDTYMKILGINKCIFYMLVTCRKCFRITNVSFSSTMVRGWTSTPLIKREWALREPCLGKPAIKKTASVCDHAFGERFRGNTIRGNRPERFWEGNLPLRGSLRGFLRGSLRGFLRGSLRGRFLEDFRGFSEVFQRPSQRPSQSAILLSELQVVLPLIVSPLK